MSASLASSCRQRPSPSYQVYSLARRAREGLIDTSQYTKQRLAGGRTFVCSSLAAAACTASASRAALWALSSCE